MYDGEPDKGGDVIVVPALSGDGQSRKRRKSSKKGDLGVKPPNRTLSFGGGGGVGRGGPHSDLGGLGKILCQHTERGQTGKRACLTQRSAKRKSEAISSTKKR